VKKFFVFLLTMIAVSAAAQQGLMINSGDFGIAGNFLSDDDNSRETTMSVLNVGIEDRRTNLGFEFSPFKYYEWKKSFSDGEKNIAYSLVNFSIYWNMLNLDFFYFGPFASINYLFIENSVNWNRFIFTGGVHLGLRADFDPLIYRIISIELGYRNIDGKGKYYVGAKFDMLVSLATIIYISAAAASSEN